MHLQLFALELSASTPQVHRPPAISTRAHWHTTSMADCTGTNIHHQNNHRQLVHMNVTYNQTTDSKQMQEHLHADLSQTASKAQLMQTGDLWVPQAQWGGANCADIVLA